MVSSRSYAAAVLVVLAACAFRPDGFTAGSPATEAPVAITPASPRGRALYAEHCALCHGDRGDGNGPAAEHLFPAPRDFTRVQFRLVSTENGAPTDADLVRVLRRGMPGSAMPSWKRLSDDDLLEVVHAVRELALDGLAERMEREAFERGESLDGTQSAQSAMERLSPGAIVEVGLPVTASAATLERGRKLFESHCATCHGADGRGQEAPRWNDDGTLNWARDFTGGIMKGGSNYADLAWRVRCGIPGTAMPALELEERDLGALVRWVQSIAPEESTSRLVQEPTTLRAVRVLATPTNVDDLQWNASTEVRLALAPLEWHRDAILEVRVSAVHDEDQLALRLRWDDASEDGASSGAWLPDALAVAFADRTDAPLVGMGSADDTIAIWQWRSAPSPSQESVLATGIHTMLGATSTARMIEAHSFGELETRPGHALQAKARRTETGWEVVLVHPLGDLASGVRAGLVTGAVTPFAVACWNGAAGETAGRKSFTIWHELALE